MHNTHDIDCAIGIREAGVFIIITEGIRRQRFLYIEPSFKDDEHTQTLAQLIFKESEMGEDNFNFAIYGT